MTTRNTNGTSTPGTRPYRPDPATSFHFYLDVGQGVAAVFTECSALEVTTDVLTYAEGGLNDHEHRLPGRTKVGDLTLKEGLAVPTGQRNFFWDWYREIIQGKITRRNISIIVCDQTGREVQRWNLFGAYPIKWSGPAFRADANTMAIQSLTLTHDGVDIL
jgi:phage tail-like protein